MSKIIQGNTRKASHMRKVLLLFGLIFSLAAGTTLFFVNADFASAESEEEQIIVERVPKSSVSHGLTKRVEASWPWYLTRASGLVAAGAAIILMLSGVGLITGHTFSFLEPITAWASHRALGIVFAVSVLLHIVALYFDNFVPFSVVDLLIPFASEYKPVTLFGIHFGSLYVALGVLSLYIIALITATSLLWIDKMPKLWKLSHLLSYVAMVFIFIHALLLGTDLSRGVLSWSWIGLAVIVLLAGMARLWRAKTV